ncbi:uncharacterized protein LOC109842592 [Asparagus officinalis]|uniref:uncharacterized protein LOC109842592 n=1 Tax=Asparagus officinalis TaxID=4686 RepID=UPI00098E1F98|nr:uncharacterized protein LOC109842592 [Asparagus officinalis]
MSSSASASANCGRRQDSTWKYTSLVEEGNSNKHKCIYCNKITNDGISRQKEHLIGTTRKRKNVSLCNKVPSNVVDKLKEYDKKQAIIRRQQAVENYMPDLEDDDMVEIDEVDEVEEQAQATRNKRKEQLTSTSKSSSLSTRGRGSVGSSTKRKGPMDSFLSFDPELEVAKDDRRRKLRQTSIEEGLNKDAVAKVHQDIARWWYQAGISFNAVQLRSFRIMLKSVGAFGPNLSPSTFHQLRESLLKKEKKYTEDLMQPHKEVWAKKGCSFMSDGWTDRKERTLINFLVNSPHGTIFLSSIDASDEIKTGARMFEILNEEIKKIGPENVVQIVTDNHASLKLAGKYLMDEYPHMYWTPCAAHCLNLILKDIGKLPFVKMTLSRAMELTGFIYSHGWILRLMRDQINARELLRPAATRFATSFLTLSIIHKQKNNLRKMFCSEKWVESKWARDPKGKYLMDEYPHMYWTPCAAHCLNLMLKDIGKLPFVKMTLSRAMELTGFIYSHGWVLRLMRDQINARELLRPAATRFATSFLTLSSIHKQKNNLRKMFCSEKWVESKWARDPKGKAAERTVKMTNFWNNVVRVLKLTGPLVRVLKLVDNERKPTMGFIYEAMDRAKEAIAKAFGDDASKYSEVFKMIDKRWNV